ncbi:MAG TPA: WecB/TagA/CpsF family glycosyltransferase [Humidesulfovibrio sp.]|uniref:WecB/TagA/CpsF family glycosyltransferase n=1 Tax=Humidesulfovibrio sp. TaxID=2910988 RepID=UPI002BCA0DE4|nr:WecB/TagA/CpsF family glycosyltransferase [Humidesulfovibrio sp.]HWR04508.1 WecB/TagA/CpsF family glycosyltransferase [Humidesulfovibrio sp.]
MHNACTMVQVSGVPVTCGTFDQVLDAVERSLGAGERRRYISITNTESMYHALRIAEHGRFIREADFSLCDGIGSVIAGYAWGHRVPRLNGPIFMLKAIDRGQSLGWRHFFYGGDVGVADTMVQKLQAEFPKLISVGTYCPPFRALTPEEDEAVVRQIREARPDFIWVGLGLLKQEGWIAAHLDQVDAPWMVGVGAAFDYHSGAVPWAPAWIQAIGMEWLFRTIIQPRRRIPRYYWSFIFMFQSIWDGLKHRCSSTTQGKHHD